MQNGAGVAVGVDVIVMVGVGDGPEVGELVGVGDGPPVGVVVVVGVGDGVFVIVGVGDGPGVGVFVGVGDGPGTKNVNRHRGSAAFGTTCGTFGATDDFRDKITPVIIADTPNTSVITRGSINFE